MMTNLVTRSKGNVYINGDSEVLEQRGRCIASRCLEIISYHLTGQPTLSATRVDASLVPTLQPCLPFNNCPYPRLKSWIKHLVRPI
jgi:hypothetical protein